MHYQQQQEYKIKPPISSLTLHKINAIRRKIKAIFQSQPYFRYNHTTSSFFHKFFLLLLQDFQVSFLLPFLFIHSLYISNFQNSSS